MDVARHMTPDEFRRSGHAIIERIARYMEEVERYPVLSQAEPGSVRARLPDAAPEQGEPFEDVLRDVEEIIVPGLTHWQSPNFYAFFPANASGPSILGDLLSSGFGVQGMLWATSPACTELETHVLDWLVDLLGLPEGFRSSTAGGGVIQDSASSSTLTALIAARERASAGATNRHGVGHGSTDVPSQRLTVYTSRHAHSSIEKGVKIAGLGRDNLRLVDADERYAMRVDALEAAIAADRAAGAVPAMVCATVGTTSSCAVDPLRAIGEVCRRENVWLHVDAAHAGSATVCPEHRGLIDGLELADSYTFNPHKWLLTNFDCSCFWVADRAALIEALSVLARVSAQPCDGIGRGHRLPRLAGAARPALPRAQALVRHPPLRCRGLARPRSALHRARRMVCGAGGGERGVRACCAGFGRPRVLPPQRGRCVHRNPDEPAEPVRRALSHPHNTRRPTGSSPRDRRSRDPPRACRGDLGAHHRHGAGARGRYGEHVRRAAMAICDLIEMNGLLGPDARLMGLDLGAKTMGVAVSDVTRTIATARTTLRRTKLTRDIEALRAMIAAEGIGGIVVGLPVNMDGSEGPRAQSTRDIAARLAEALALPVAFWDERLSTVAAERPLLDADLSRRKRARVVDRVAAAYILQGALDRLRRP